MKTLGTVRAGDRVRVCRLKGGREVTTRLAAAGFTPGAEAVVVQDFGRGPLLVEIRGSRVALGRGEALKVEVEVIRGGVTP
jgi:ferrous iron transport protein A